MGVSVITRELPTTSKVESAVKLANGKAAEVLLVYLVRGVRVTECNDFCWVFLVKTRVVIFYYLTS